MLTENLFAPMFLWFKNYDDGWIVLRLENDNTATNECTKDDQVLKAKESFKFWESCRRARYSQYGFWFFLVIQLDFSVHNQNYEI